jgi:phospholipase C
MSMHASSVFSSRSWQLLASSALALCLSGGAIAADPAPRDNAVKTATPIKHVIVVIGENRTFDHVYGTYVPNPS